MYQLVFYSFLVLVKIFPAYYYSTMYIVTGCTVRLYSSPGQKSHLQSVVETQSAQHVMRLLGSSVFSALAAFKYTISNL